MKRREFIALLGGVLLAGGALLTTASFAQGIGRWIISTPMPSSRTEVAVAEVGGKIYVVDAGEPRPLLPNRAIDLFKPTPTHGYAPTREAAMAALAKSWRWE